MMPLFEKMILQFQSANIEEFRLFAEKVKAAGGTHVAVSQVPKSFWMWEADFSNPYHNWSMRQCQLFKLVVPEGLKKYLPVDHAALCFKLVIERCAVLEKLGLKGALFSNEPFWLPEAVFQDHPAWRGPRIDHPRRSTVPVYSPCIDNPEVLEMYSYAMETIVRATNIDYVSFKSNDAGGGICWSTGLYPGPNGPASCKNRSMGDRITGFLNALSGGAKAGGREITVNFDSNLGFKEPEFQVDMVWPRLQKNQTANGKNQDGKTPVAVVPPADRALNPVLRVPLIMHFARALEAAAASGKPVAIINMPSSDLGECWIYLSLFSKNPARGYADTVSLVKKTAETLEPAPGAADALVDSFRDIEDVFTAIQALGLNMLEYGPLHQRWINRPFVPFPDELPAEYRDYYRKYQFQAQGEEHAKDLMDIQGIEAIRGFSGVFLATHAVRRARQGIEKARGHLAAVSEQSPNGNIREKINLTGERLAVLDHFLRCITNAAEFQEILDRTDFERTPQTDCRWPTRNDRRIEHMQNIMRDEIDNVNELADLIDGRVKLFLAAEEESRFEDIFTYGPDLANQLRLKARIMLEHLSDLNRLYETNNI
jgi:hypothetical protein